LAIIVSGETAPMEILDLFSRLSTRMSMAAL